MVIVSATRSEPAGSHRQASWALWIGVLSISFAAIFFRKAQPTHPLVAAAVRLGVAALILAPMGVRGFRRGHLSGVVLSRAAAAGLMYAVHFGAWVTSLALTTVAASVTLVTATPLLLAGVSLITGRDKPDRRLWAALGLAVVGVAIIGAADLAGPDGAAAALAGDALALLGAMAMAGYLLLARSLGPDLDVWAFASVATAVGACSLLVVAISLGVPVTVASPQALGYLALAALLPQLVGHTLLTWALRHTRPTAVGVATVGEPACSTALAWLWLGEPVRWVVGVGCVVTVLAVIAALRRHGRSPVVNKAAGRSMQDKSITKAGSDTATPGDA